MLIVHLSEEDIPEKIRFEGGTSWEVFPVLANNFSTEANWLTLMALYTALRRIESKDQGRCPCFSEVSSGHMKSIAEATYNLKNFTLKRKLGRPARGRKKADDGVDLADSEEMCHWLVKIFGEPPGDLYLVGSRSHGSANLRFDESVEISVVRTVWSSEVRKEVHSDPITNEDELRNAYLAASRNLFGLEKDLLIVININDPTIREAPHQTIDSRQCDGWIRGSGDFDIAVTATFRTNLALFWISSRCEAFPIYPYWGLEGEVDTNFEAGDRITTLRAGRSCRFQVHAPEGYDVCLLLARGKEFAKSEIAEILALLNDSLLLASLSKNLRPDARPILEKCSVARRRAPTTDPRFGVVGELDNWKLHFSRAIAGKAETLCFFTIPNRPS